MTDVKFTPSTWDAQAGVVDAQAAAFTTAVTSATTSTQASSGTPVDAALSGVIGPLVTAGARKAADSATALKAEAAKMRTCAAQYRAVEAKATADIEAFLKSWDGNW